MELGGENITAGPDVIRGQVFCRAQMVDEQGTRKHGAAGAAARCIRRNGLRSLARFTGVPTDLDSAGAGPREYRGDTSASGQPREEAREKGRRVQRRNAGCSSHSGFRIRFAFSVSATPDDPGATSHYTTHDC